MIKSNSEFEIISLPDWTRETDPSRSLPANLQWALAHASASPLSSAAHPSAIFSPKSRPHTPLLRTAVTTGVIPVVDVMPISDRLSSPTSRYSTAPVHLLEPRRPLPHEPASPAPLHVVVGHRGRCAKPQGHLLRAKVDWAKGTTPRPLTTCLGCRSLPVCATSRSPIGAGPRGLWTSYVLISLLP
jgi:hypothetical protein